MDTTTAGGPGIPCWAQLGSPDPQTAAAFYGALFGWDFTEDPARGPGHLTARLRGLPVAGLGPVDDLPRPGWTACFTVHDTGKAAAAVAAAGGTVLARAAAGGREDLYADPSGAHFAVREPDARQAPSAAAGPGGFALAELITDDVDASAAFYGALFGWTAGDPAGPLGRREWRLDGTPVSLLLPRPAAMPRETPPYWDAYFTVTDVAAAATRATSAGGTLLMPSTDIGSGSIAVLLDPMGAVLTLVEPRA
ncbi:VOC family protein [Actinacidiphila glaucinigra]|uniref:VOC family protein n=1 Tax=Actinacidiphila glaucinigra TaxID=235986 RepID=UPI0035DBB65E